MRMREIQENVLNHLPTFSIWNAGREGKKFFKSLSVENQKKVLALCDVDEKKIRRKKFEVYDEHLRKVTATLPIISYRDCKPPVIICIKLGLTDGVFEKLLAEKKEWREQKGDFFHFN